jgi:hypothetical protein
LPRQLHREKAPAINWTAGAANPDFLPAGFFGGQKPEARSRLAQKADVPPRLATFSRSRRYQRRNGPRLLPRDVFISVEQRTPGNLDPDEWAILRRVIDLIQVNAKGAELGPVLETIENALRADQAKLIEAE